WAASDPGAALAFVLTQPEPWRGSSAASLFAELTRRDPALAMTFATQAKEQGLRSDLANLVLRPWAMADPSAALRWIADQARPENRYAFAEACIRSACSQLGLADAAEKLKPLGLTSEEYDTLLWRAISSGLDYAGRENPENTLKAILSMKDPAIRRESIRFIGMGNLSAEQKATLLNSLPPGADRENFLYGQARLGIMSFDFEPGKALQGIAAVAPAQQDALLRELGAKWGANDPVGASRWLVDEPPGPRRDAVAGEFVRSLVRTDPEAALIWSARLGDEGKRSRRFAELLPLWAAKDPVAADAWVESAGVLSEEDRVTLRGVLAKTRK
ncbi:MAG TPA: hypothetical protein VHM91_23415, partial [Verrucomicrobiales bacterium]|nr:hypothetical protein [Verrucomicrobiales bacterium]